MEAVLARSLEAAAQGVDANPEEKVFHILDHVFLGTKFAAADRDLLDTLEVRAVINLTAASSRVPNYFDDGDIEYLHLELLDELISYPGHAIPQAYRAIKRFGESGKNVLVHCSAGLSRSATAVLAWLMRERGMSLKSGKELIERQRGRRPKCNPSFWCYLSALERELFRLPSGSEPSIDWLPLLVEDMRLMGVQQSAERVAVALRTAADWVDFVTFYTLLSGSGMKQLLVAQAVSQRPKPDPKVACRAVSCALEFMEVYHDFAPLQAYTLRILQPLLCHADARVRSSILASGIVGKALETMRAHANSADVQEAGCATLAYVTNASPDFANEVAFLNGPARMVEALRRHPRHEALQATGWIGLAVLLQYPVCAAQLRALDTSKVVRASLQAHPTSEKVQRYGTLALHSLTEDRVKPVDGGGDVPSSGTTARERLTGA
mmetsp:Transcript_134349/g.388898  ORF Transcript_134349/g.388898 Transcript_134349/m.388898 type:complete len:437 (-) Transcript_134349:250-1560(-)|eukprot:CAMPEP_0176146010 /NCGR_PEP_ID=MMETSP0120_2-20121206/74399_1 /TAXON_ID=160619 /ORGANISM="Kryptoperidinium foliaceum, Strain CCMP 1326" /LENGTH=436 /DNA_ID=CAMNT_0017482531 /DNA_START=66 /DNA_END=1376 /DNA_ORIENTATION=-